MKRNILGINKAGQTVSVDIANISNGHRAAIGKSGVGKTTAILSGIIDDAKDGEVTVAINWHNCVNRNMIMPELKETYERYCKVIDVAREGIQLPLFEKGTDSSGREESDYNIVQRVTSLLKVATNLSPTQEGEVYKAVKTVQNEDLYRGEGLVSIYDWLLSQDKAVATNAAAKLRPLCGNHILVNGNFWEEGVKIYEFDLNGLQYDEQLVVVRFLLDYFLRLANSGRFLRTGLNLFLDECQNLEFGAGSTMYTLINESRRLNVRLRLAAPTIISSKKKEFEIITQCGVCLYFQPIDKDRRKTAEFISPKDSDSWAFLLSRLQKGQFVATGNFIVDGKPIARPIQLRTYIPEIPMEEDIA
jgi:hypothetical protein